MSTFDISVRTDHSGRPVVALSGELDLATADRVTSLAQSAGDGPLRLDLSGVTFLDSTGLGALISLKHAGSGTAGVELLATSPAVDRVLALAGLTDLFAQTQAASE